MSITKRSTERINTILVFPSDLGWMGVVVAGDVVKRLTFGHCSSAAAKKACRDQGDSPIFADTKIGTVPKIIVDMTTSEPSLAVEIAETAAKSGVRSLDAPVSGGDVGAREARLTIMIGGDAEAIESLRPCWAAMGKTFVRQGGPGAGQHTKMVNQILIAGLVQGIAEGMSFGLKAGLPMEEVIAVIGKGAAQSWQLDNRGKTMCEGKFDFGFAVDWMRKDLGLVLDEAKRNGARLPVTALVDQFYADVQKMGGGRWDTSSLIRRLR